MTRPLTPDESEKSQRLKFGLPAAEELTREGLLEAGEGLPKLGIPLAFHALGTGLLQLVVSVEQLLVELGFGLAAREGDGGGEFSDVAELNRAKGAQLTRSEPSWPAGRRWPG